MLHHDAVDNLLFNALPRRLELALPIRGRAALSPRLHCRWARAVEGLGHPHPLQHGAGKQGSEHDVIVGHGEVEHAKARVALLVRRGLDDPVLAARYVLAVF